jgi:hypothetical protein
MNPNAIQEGVQDMIDDTKGFAQNSIMFLTKCTKPDKKGSFMA